MGSTPTGASSFFRLAVCTALAVVTGAALPAATAFGQPHVPLLSPYTPGPGAASPGYVGTDLAQPAAPNAGGETVRQYTEEQMKGYFDGRVADEYVDDCTWESRVCYGYLAIDSLFWDRMRSTGSTMAVRSSTDAMIFNGRNFIWNDLESVPRLTAGYVFDNGFALEGTYFYKDDLDTSAGIQIPGDISVNAFGTTSAAFAPNFFQADTFGAWTAVSMQGLETHLVQTNEFFNILFGFRWIELRDRLAITTTKGGAFSGLDVRTHNNLFGGQLGVKMHTEYGFWGVDAFAKAGMYLNAGKGHVSVVNAGAGLADQTRNSEGNSEAFIAEAQVMATYNPYIWMYYRLGWQVMLIQQTSLAQDQIHSNDLTGFTLQERGDILYHGPFAGVEFVW